MKGHVPWNKGKTHTKETIEKIKEKRSKQIFIRKNYPNIDGYIVNHEAVGTDLPHGKQLIVLNKDAFNYENIG
jgi:hypothetical protein